MGERARAGDGVIAGGRPRRRAPGRSATRRTRRYLGGSLGAAHADTIVPRAAARRPRARAGRRLHRVRRRAHAGGRRGARPATRGSSAQHVALSGSVPQISVICGASAGGGSYSPALTDFVVMTEARDDVPHRPRASCARSWARTSTADELGGPSVHERNGVCALRRRGRRATPRCSSRDLLDYLPAARRRRARSLAEPRRPTAPTTACRTTERKVYDVRDVDPRASSTAAGCSSRRRAGRATSSAASRASTAAPVGVIANQPRYLGGVLDAESRAEGRALRAHLQRVRPAARRARRHARLHARHAPGARRRDPPRREARARVRRGDGAEA